MQSNEEVSQRLKILLALRCFRELHSSAKTMKSKTKHIFLLCATFGVGIVAAATGQAAQPLRVNYICPQIPGNCGSANQTTSLDADTGNVFLHFTVIPGTPNDCYDWSYSVDGFPTGGNCVSVHDGEVDTQDWFIYGHNAFFYPLGEVNGVVTVVGGNNVHVPVPSTPGFMSVPGEHFCCCDNGCSQPVGYQQFVEVVIGSDLPPDENQTENCHANTGCSGPECSNEGMAKYSVHLLLASLHIEDTPIQYNCPHGVPADFRVVYNQREAHQPETFDYSNLGPKWTFNWLSYVTDYGPNENPSVYVRGGGTEVFGGFNSGTGEYAADKQSLAVLVRNPNGTFERRFPDGSKEEFSKPDGSPSYPRRMFLTNVTDAAGNPTTLSYHADGSLRITEIYDSVGNPPTTLIYPLTGDTFKIAGVKDPFRRLAIFDYTSGKLTKITDPALIESQFIYEDGSDFVKTLITPYGTTQFTTGQVGNSIRWVEATDPRGGKERIEYNGSSSDIPDTELLTPPGVYNNKLRFQNTFYWDKKAMAEAPGDYSKAHVFHWLQTEAGKISGIKHSEKKALENRVWFQYENQPDPTKVGTTALPIKVARIVGENNDQIQLRQYTYNSLGNIRSETDPVGRVKSYEYWPNNIDVHRVFQRNPDGVTFDPDGSLADIITVYTYSDTTHHLLSSSTDAAGQTTSYHYNSYGQVCTRTDPSYNHIPGEVTTYTYNMNDVGQPGCTRGYLVSVVNNSGETQFRYDPLPLPQNVKSITNVNDSYEVTNYYDDLDRKTLVTYPDGSTEEFQFSQDFGQGPKTILDLTASKDRLGRWTYRHYNGNRQMDWMMEPASPGSPPMSGHTTLYDWCACGSLVSITDPDLNGHITIFERDLQSRVTTKRFADASTIKYGYEPGSSRLSSTRDALNQTTTYLYYADDNVRQVQHANSLNWTPWVEYTYEPYYNRLSLVQDGVGNISHTYYPAGVLGAGQVQTVGGYFSNDTITYTYDELGRMQSQSIGGGVPESVTYDALDRLHTTTNVLGQFTRQYDGSTNRLTDVFYAIPSNQKTHYTYFGNDHDRRLQFISNSTGPGNLPNLSRFDYTYDAEGEVLSWSKTFGAGTSGLWFGYDPSKRLISARNAFDTSQATQELDYSYDAAGNRSFDRNYNPNGPIGNGSSNTYGINALNQVVNRTTNANETNTYVYDAVGNLTYDGADKTFEWDAANRLIAINYFSTGNRTEFAYDGLGRRVRITEYGPGMTAEIEPQKDNYETFTAGSFKLSSDTCTLTFQGLNPSGGDNTMLIDSVMLNGLPPHNNSFEYPIVNNYQSSPAGGEWSFVGAAGLAENGGTYGNPSTTDGQQAAFVSGYGSVSQTMAFPQDNYVISLNAAQRTGNDSTQRVRVIFRTSASVITSKTFVWCGNRICEERDESGATVTKRFFTEGEQWVNTSNPGNYYYTRDHLGSIREVTNSNGSVMARYDYDPYGNRIVLNGKMDFDLGYTGHYYHGPSRLNLTLYRAYDPELGRWISRDPLMEEGGLNLYEYVQGNSINATDPLGLRSAENYAFALEAADAGARADLQAAMGGPNHVLKFIHGGVEYGGRVCKEKCPRNRSKPYYYTGPTKQYPGKSYPDQFEECTGGIEERVGLHYAHPDGTEIPVFDQMQSRGWAGPLMLARPAGNKNAPHVEVKPYGRWPR